MKRYIAAESSADWPYEWIVIDLEYPRAHPPHPRVIAANLSEEHAHLIADGKQAKWEDHLAKEGADAQPR